MQDLLLPSEVEFSQGESATSADLVITPCHFGYGTTLGNALRRVLLSSLPGAAVEAFKIKGTQHEFTAVEGVKEDVVQIILNLKQLAVKVHSNEMVTLKLKKKSKGVVKAGDIEKNADVEIMNKDLVIANLTADKEFEMDLIVGKGRGFRTAEEKDKKDYDLGTIVIDSLYNPVKDVGYSVEHTRVGDITNYEKLTVHLDTNGVLTPREATNLANQILMDHFNIIDSTIGDGPVTEEPVVEVEEEKVEIKEKVVKKKKAPKESPEDEK
jgi:DNA-directed RNA polymerase subunit alpha